MIQPQPSDLMTKSIALAGIALTPPHQFLLLQLQPLVIGRRDILFLLLRHRIHTVCILRVVLSRA